MRGEEVCAVDCRRRSEDLQAYVDGELDEGARSALLAHVDDCPRCRAELVELQAVARTLSEAPLEEPSASFLPAIRRRLAGARPTRRGVEGAPSTGARTSRRPLLAALGVLGLACLLLLVRLGGGEDGPGDLPAPMDVHVVVSAGSLRCNDAPVTGRRELRRGDRLEAGPDSEAWIRWADGTKVKLRADSQLMVFPRKLFLREGEIWVEVTKGRGGFSVTTPFAVAAVKGTRFTVRSRAGASAVEVHEGRVEVRSGRGGVSAGAVAFEESGVGKDLVAGRRARVRAEEATVAVDDFDDGGSLLHDTADFTVERDRGKK